VLYGGGVLALVELVLLVYCVLNVITTPESEVRNLPKLLWLLLVVVLPLVGGIAWLIAGRPQGRARPTSGPTTTRRSCGACASERSSSAGLPSSSAARAQVTIR
jgi:hypothetical protein